METENRQKKLKIIKAKNTFLVKSPNLQQLLANSIFMSKSFRIFTIILNFF